MGYCWQGRKLCCDNCGGAGARKYKCPAGWCPASALCPKCKKDPVVKAKEQEAHKNCALCHAEFKAKEAERERLILSGAMLRVSAMAKGDRVQVIFHGKSKDSDIGFYMTHAMYDAIPLGANATPDDYRKFGELIPAPKTFYTP